MKGEEQENHKHHVPRVRERYDYYVDEDNGELYYTFETPEADYTVYFNPAEYKNRVAEYPCLLNNAYGFGFFQFPRQGVAIPNIDIKIKHTIEKIVCDFYDDMPNAVLLYHCYYADGKQGKRSKKFERWYCSSPAKDSIRKHEISLEIFTNGEHIVHYLGYLCSRHNRDMESIHMEFESFALSLPGSK